MTRQLVLNQNDKEIQKLTTGQDEGYTTDVC